MATYQITAPDGNKYRLTGPDNASQQDLIGALLAQHPMAGQTTAELESYKSAPVSAGNYARNIGAGVFGAGKSLVDFFGTGSELSKGLGEAHDYLQQGLTPERKEEIARRNELQDRAARSGSLFQEAKAFMGGVAEAPFESLAQAAGSSVPTILTGILALPVDAPVALGLGVATIAKFAVGAIQGEGERKGGVFDAVKAEYKKQGKSDAEAEKLAIKSSEFSRETAFQTGGAMLLGALDAATGIEPSVGKAMRKAAPTGQLTTEAIDAGIGALKKEPLKAPTYKGQLLKGIAEESPLEGAQGAFGQYSENLAAQQAGADVTPMQGVLGAGLRDATVGALFGGVGSPLGMKSARQDFATDQFLRQAKDIQEQDKQAADALREQQEQRQKTESQLGAPITGKNVSNILMLPAPAKEPEVERDPLQNPIGNIAEKELGSKLVGDIKAYRKDNNLPPLKSYSIEDIKDAVSDRSPEEQEGIINRILAFKTNHQGETYTPQNILESAIGKNIATETKGWNDFLTRVTGKSDLETMTQPELHAVSNSLEELKKAGRTGKEAQLVLPEGSNATRFTQEQYNAGVTAALLGDKPVTLDEALKRVQTQKGVDSDQAAERLLRSAAGNDDLTIEKGTGFQAVSPGGTVLGTYASEAEAKRNHRRADILPVETELVAPRVKESTEKVAQLPEGYEIKTKTVAGESTPATYVVRVEGSEKNESQYFGEEDRAKERLNALTRSREASAKAQEAAAGRIQENLEKEQAKIVKMETDGLAGTTEHTNAVNKFQAAEVTEGEKVKALLNKAEELRQPLKIVPLGKKTARVEKHTVIKNGKEIGAFTGDKGKTGRTKAEEHILSQASEEELQTIADRGGVFGKRAEVELDTRKRPGVRGGTTAGLEAVGVHTPEVEAKLAELKAKLLPMLKKFGLEQVGLNVVRAIENDADGAWGKADKLIRIALQATKPIKTMRHEALHALKELGFFTDAQWEALKRQAEKTWVNKYLKGVAFNDTMSRYDAYANGIKDADGKVLMPALSAEDILEEAIADAFGDWEGGATPPPGLMAALFKRLQNFFSALRQALTGAGFESADEIFGKIERGELKAGKEAAGTEAKLSLPTEEKPKEKIDPNDVSQVVINGPYADAALRTMNSQITQTSKPLEVDDVGRLFDKAFFDEFARKGEWNNPADFQRAVNQAVTELKHQLQQAKSGLDWYEEDIAEAFKQTQRYIPSLKKPEKRALFSVIAGIMSPSVNARDNWVIAAQAYQHYEKTGTLPGSNPATGSLWQGGLESGNKKKQLDMLNAMLQPKSKGGLGEKAAIEWLQGDHTVAEITNFRKKYGGMGKSSTGGKATDILPGFTAFGPKVGPFVMNINGIHDVTVDVWMTRTFNRYFGQMMGPDGTMLRSPTEPQRVAIKRLAMDAAAQVGIKPYQVQSTLWFFEQQLFNKLGTGAKSYGFSDGAIKFIESQGGVAPAKGAPANVGANAPANKPAGKQAVGNSTQAAQPATGQQGVRDDTKLSLSSGQSTLRSSGRSKEKLNYGNAYSLRSDVQSYRGRNEQQPETHTRRSLEGGGGVRVLGAKPIAQYTPTGPFKDIVNQHGFQSPVFYEIAKKDADVFEKAIQASKNTNPYGSAVYVYPLEEYNNMRTFLTEDGKSGFALKGNDIVSVFSGAPHKGSVNSSIQLAVQEGGRKLDAFATVLPEIYHANGFKIVGRTKWNEEYKPDNWDKQRFVSFNNGEPDVVYMAYDPDNNQTIYESPGEYFDDSDELAKAQDEAVEKYFNEGLGYGTKKQNQRTRELKTKAERLYNERGIRRGLRLLDDETRAKYPYLEEPVEGLPATVKVNGVDVTFGPYVPAREASVLYAEQSGIPYRQQASYHKLDPDFSRTLASAYLKMVDDPLAPNVKVAYKAWGDETIAQYKAMLKTGITIEFMPNNKDPYGSPRNAILDVINNNHLYVFPVDGGFGADAITEEQIKNNPALAYTDVEISGRPARLVEVFRATHDFYGHVKEGFGFRAEEEENAFQSHVRMYSPLAARAMTAGTRGQNSVVNFGPYAEFNKTASGEATKYADQKIGLLPEWATNTNIAPDIQKPEIAAANQGSGITLGEQQPNAQTFAGIHYGNQQVDVLLGDKHGTGTKGAERKRLESSSDPRIKRRVYFYTQKSDGTMSIPEAGVGHHVYTQKFNNILGPGSEMSRLFSEGDSNYVESKVVDAGYDGYALPDSGMMVILNHDVPVNYRGTRAELLESDTKLSLPTYFPTAEEAEQAAYQKAPPLTPEFKRFFGASRAKEEGRAQPMFHASMEDFNIFRENRPIFISPDASFAEDFIKRRISESGSLSYLSEVKDKSAKIYPLWVRAETPFDYENKAHVQQIVNYLQTNYAGWVADLGVKDLVKDLNAGKWTVVENSRTQEALKTLGFDSFYTAEGGAKNLAVFKANQVKSITGNLGSFDEGGDIRYSLPVFSAADEARVNETAQVREHKGVISRILDAFAPESLADLRASFIHRYNQFGVYDRLLAEKMGGKVLLADMSAEAAANMSDLSASVTYAAFGIGNRKGGVPRYKNGATIIDTSVKGPLEIISPLAQFSDPKAYQHYQFWAGVKRGSRFLATGVEENYETSDIALAEKYRKAYMDKGVNFITIQEEMNTFNDGLVDYMVTTGVLSKGKAAEFKRHMDYIPFYRQLNGEDTVGPKIFNSISGVKPPKKIKHSEAPLTDYLESIVQNTQAAINAGMKNMAAQRAISVAMQLGPIAGAQKLTAVNGAPDCVTVLENGEAVSYRVADQLFINAMKSLNMVDMPWLGIFSGPSNVLRNLVTKDPGFMLANLARDSLSAWVTSGTNMTPIIGTAANFVAALGGKSPIYHALLNAGILGGYEFSSGVMRSAESFQKDLNKKYGSNKGALPLRAFKGVWEALEHGTEASDAATRMAVYERVLAETGNETEALYRALEVMNFNRKGSSPIARILTAAIPFLNARIQGLDVFYRTAMGQNVSANAKEMQRAFFVRGATLMALSAAYFLAVSDDDEWKKQEQETKDNYWIFPGVGKFPTPFEVGFLFKTVPERLMALTFKDDTSQDFKDSMIRGLGNTLAFNPIPQIAKPFVEYSANYNFFTGRPIVGQGMEGLEPQYQVGPNTTHSMEWLGKQLGLSPIKLEQLYNSYTGTMGMYALTAIDSVLDMQGNSPHASKRFEQLPIIKRFAADPEARGNITQFYELKKAVDAAVQTENLLLKAGKPEEFMEFMEKNKGLLAIKPYVANIEKSMKQMRETRKMVQGAEMSGDEKRDTLTSVGQMENNLTTNIQTVKKMISEF